jgi:uncharacterized membrane protein
MSSAILGPFRGEVLNVRDELTRRRSTVGLVIDAAGRWLATPLSLLVLCAVVVVWIAINTRVPQATWDPPPFMLLGTLTSALAPVVSILILMTQHRNERVAEIREEVALQVDLRTDRQMTLLLRALDEAARRRLEGQASDVELLREPLDPGDLLRQVREHLDRLEGRPTGERLERSG